MTWSTPRAIPAACTLMSTSWPRGVGSSMSRSRSTSADPYLSWVIAFTGVLLDVVCLRLLEPIGGHRGWVTGEDRRRTEPCDQQADAQRELPDRFGCRERDGKSRGDVPGAHEHTGAREESQ